MPKRKLPLLAERSLAEMKASRLGIANSLETKLRLVSCHAGCSACCSHPRYISILEGLVLYQYLTAKGQWTPLFRAKLEAHADQTFDLAAEVWLMLNLPCPVLDKNGKCLAYEARPFSCRTIYATSDPLNCHPNRLTDAHFVDRQAEGERFREAERKILARHGLALFGIPISKAILLGEKIMTGEGDLEHFFSLAVESTGEPKP
jgi:Fe-S-cluster containining protein